MELDNSDDMRPFQKSEYPQAEIMEKWNDFTDSDLPSERNLYESTKCMHTRKSIKCDNQKMSVDMYYYEVLCPSEPLYCCNQGM